MLHYILCITCKHFCSIFFLRRRTRWLLVAIVSLLYIFIFVLYVLSILDYMFDIEKDNLEALKHNKIYQKLFALAYVGSLGLKK